jgi:hypothetical protein
VRLEQSLVLNRYFHRLFNADGLEALKEPLNVQEGSAGDGQSYFYRVLSGRVQDPALEVKLAGYDARVMGYEARLAKARGSFAFKYFQYLAVLYTEVFLDRLTDEPQGFTADLNTFLEKLKAEDPSLVSIPPFTASELRRLAFFMATGSGKTLILHVNLWHVLDYLKRGRHPEALVRRADGRREFDSIILVTPNEGLSEQHGKEFAKSGIDFRLLIEDRSSQRTFGPCVKVIEISKLAEEASGDGVSVPLEELGGANLVFVDEGHKGTGSEAQTWKRRQRRLSAAGFLLEYSATFAQSIGAASLRAQEGLLAEYGKCILMDYSYRHFYDDGYGKDFSVLNLSRGRASQAHELLLGGLLTFYRQYRLFHTKQAEYHAYNLEKPLWVFLGSKVSGKKGYERDASKTAEQERSDVARVVEFLREFLDNRTWAVQTIRKIIEGKGGFIDEETKQDLFKAVVEEFGGRKADTLHHEICRDMFHGSGGLELWELKNAEGELGLRVSTGGKEGGYFGVINIGDVSAFKIHIKDNLKLEVKEDRFSRSLFGEINASDSRTNLLIGSKKFIEGWSSWRVSTMGLLNMGRGEGPQVIQLFGRGVRLKGKRWTLKRSAKLPGEGPHPQGLGTLETLFIFGWNADYIAAFHDMIEKEEIGQELTVQLKLFEPCPKLLVPRPRKGYNAKSETWTLEAEPLNVSVDLTARVEVLLGRELGGGQTGGRVEVDFNDARISALIDLDALYADLLEYKTDRQYGNVFIPRGRILPILQGNLLYLPESESADPRALQEGASRLLKAYLDRYVARKEREAESCNLEPAVLMVKEQTAPYRVRVTEKELLRDIQGLLKQPTELYKTGEKPLPRLHIDRHLFSPVLLDPERRKIKGISVSPPGLTEGEEKLLNSIAAFWKDHHAEEPFKDLEIYLYRNLPRVGVGFFRSSGFYPDFILWLKNRQTKATHIRFIEPHGMHHDGLGGKNASKIEAFRELANLSQTSEFKKEALSLDGFILTETDKTKIIGAENKSWDTLESEHCILRQHGEYCRRLLVL